MLILNICSCIIILHKRMSMLQYKRDGTESPISLHPIACHVMTFSRSVFPILYFYYIYSYVNRVCIIDLGIYKGARRISTDGVKVENFQIMNNYFNNILLRLKFIILSKSPSHKLPLPALYLMLYTN